MPPPTTKIASARAAAVYRALRHAIIEQALEPGAKLPEDAIGERFGVSRTLVRHALGQLAAEGLVEFRRNRGAAGDVSLIRMANLYANIAQLGRREDLQVCLDMVTSSAAKLMRLSAYGIAVGNPADLIALPCSGGPDVVAEIAHPVLGVKGGRRTFVNPPARLLDQHPVEMRGG